LQAIKQATKSNQSKASNQLIWFELQAIKQATKSNQSKANPNQINGQTIGR
jgi:hypothetical protein